MFVVTTSGRLAFDDPTHDNLARARTAAQTLEILLGEGAVQITEILPASYREENPQYTGPLHRQVNVHPPVTKGRVWSGGQEAETHLTSLVKSIQENLTASGFIAPDAEVFADEIVNARMTGEINYPAVFLIVKESTNGAVPAAKDVIFKAEKDFAANQVSRSLSKFK